MSQAAVGRTIIVSIIGLLFSFTTSCRKDLDYDVSNSPLQFSQDTVFLDTIFTQSNSETYLLKVYNPSDDDISLSQIYLNKRENSSFRINVDGLAGFEFNEVPLRAKDSLMVFVEVAVADSNAAWIEEDELVFADSDQHVKLLAMVEEATYYYPQNGEDFAYINENTTWDNSSSRVIMGTLKVAENTSLNITEGAKIYFHQNSSLHISSGGSLNLNGSSNSPILIRGARHDARYDTLPKQWNQIKLVEANLNANHVIIKGGTNGFNLSHATAQIANTQIYNMASSGIFAFDANITASNLAISDAGDACLNIENGGEYNFYYSTFANNWETGVVGINGPKIPAYFSNYATITQDDGSESEVQNNFSGTFANCIFYGYYPNGIYLDPHEGATFTYNFDSCLIKNQDTAEADYASYPNVDNPFFGNPYFYSTLLSHQDLRIQPDSESQAIGHANPAYNTVAPYDIKGDARSSSSPTIGAYEN